MPTATGEERVTSIDDLDIVIDADGHAQETFDDILEHLDDGHEQFEEFVLKGSIESPDVVAVDR